MVIEMAFVIEDEIEVVIVIELGVGFEKAFV